MHTDLGHKVVAVHTWPGWPLFSHAVYRVDWTRWRDWSTVRTYDRGHFGNQKIPYPIHENLTPFQDEPNGLKSYGHFEVHIVLEAIQNIMQFQYPNDQQWTHECSWTRPWCHLEVHLGNIRSHFCAIRFPLWGYYARIHSRSKHTYRHIHVRNRLHS